MTAAVIADIVGSRALPDRAGAQRSIERALAGAEKGLGTASTPFRATVGDEFQGAYPTIADALRTILLVQLALPEGIELRFGVGVGGVRPLDSAAEGLTDGPGWWAARAAIDEVHRLQKRAVPAARTWIVAGEDQDEAVTPVLAVANAYALARDELVAAMSARTRRLVHGRCLGRPQRELAGEEGITQSAVSQALGAAGASAVVAGFHELGAPR